jgi:deoxyribonuclease II
MKFLIGIFVIFQLLSVVFGIADRIGCRDEDGNLVDWFYLYKLPKIVGKSETGLNYLFVTSSSSDWTMSQKLMNDSSSMVGKTFEEIYVDRKDNKIKVLYNDEPPTGEADEVRGHTKGVVVANDISGFWIVHSVPKFPPEIEKGAYDFPESGRTYGQSFLCISMTGDQIWKVGKQLQFNEPHFYSSHVPDNLRL